MPSSVGAGVNGVLAAAELALAGWSVTPVQRNRVLGGFIATEERTEPDTDDGYCPLPETRPDGCRPDPRARGR
jgi:phytoene dehydrogenase-like protein